MPVERGHEPDLACPWLAWDNRRYENGEDIDAGYNGYTSLKLDGELIHVEYIDLEGRLTFTKDWQVDLSSGKLDGPNLRKIIDDPAAHFRHLP